MIRHSHKVAGTPLKSLHLVKLCPSNSPKFSTSQLHVRIGPLKLTQEFMQISRTVNGLSCAESIKCSHYNKPEKRDATAAIAKEITMAGPACCLATSPVTT